MIRMSILLNEGPLDSIDLFNIVAIHTCSKCSGGIPFRAYKPEDFAITFNSKAATDRAANQTGWEQYDHVDNCLVMKFHKEHGFYISPKGNIPSQYFRQWRVYAD